MASAELNDLLEELLLGCDPAGDRMAGVEIAMGVLRAQGSETVRPVAAWLLGGVSQLLYLRYGVDGYRENVRRLAGINRRWET